MKEWEEEGGNLVNDYTFKDFSVAFAFMTQVAIVSEKMNHHPTWTNTYNKVSFKLTTHDAGSFVTVKDRKLAEAIQEIAHYYIS